MTNKILVIFLVILSVTSCSYNSESVAMKSLDGKWDKKTVQKFNFNIKNIENPKNIIFVIRNNDDYPYSNIRLIASITNLKTKKKETDTLNYVLAEPNGKWIGKGFGATKETLFQYKLNYRFPENGAYTVEILQAMRQDNLQGIEDFGVKIENSKP